MPPESWVEDEEETISINYTAGTTEGGAVNVRGAYLNALSEVIVAGMSPESVYLWTVQRLTGGKVLLAARAK